jgi:hypothetical protein
MASIFIAARSSECRRGCGVIALSLTLGSRMQARGIGIVGARALRGRDDETPLLMPHKLCKSWRGRRAEEAPGRRLENLYDGGEVELVAGCRILPRCRPRRALGIHESNCSRDIGRRSPLPPAHWPDGCGMFRRQADLFFLVTDRQHVALTQ